MTPTDLDRLLAKRQKALRRAQAAQARELKARQTTGRQTVGPYAPALEVRRPTTSPPAMLSFPPAQRRTTHG